MIALKSFVVDKIYIVKKISNDEDDEILIKNLLEFNFKLNLQKILE